LRTLLAVWSFMLGAAIGSFCNVVIWRLPRGESLVRPGSRCPTCGTPIHWYDNLPVVGYLLLRGLCRECGAVFSARYAVVEALTGAIFLGVYLHLSQAAVFVAAMPVYWALCAALVCVGFIDADHRIIPESITGPGLALGVLVSVLLPALHARGWPATSIEGPRLAALAASGMGAVIGAGSLFVIGALGEVAFRKEAMGGGDLRLMAMVGAVLGWQLALLAVLLSAAGGAVIGAILALRTRDSHIPYGPYLAGGSVVSLLWGWRMIEAYVAFLLPSAG